MRRPRAKETREPRNSFNRSTRTSAVAFGFTPRPPSRINPIAAGRSRASDRFTPGYSFDALWSRLTFVCVDLCGANRISLVNDFASMLETQIPSLRRYSRVLCRDPDRADDLVQDCLCRAMRKSHLFVPGSNLRAERRAPACDAYAMKR